MCLSSGCTDTHTHTHTHTHSCANTDSTHTNFQTKTHTNTQMHIYTYRNTHSGTHKIHTYTEAFRHKHSQTHRCTHTHKYMQTPPEPTHTTSASERKSPGMAHRQSLGKLGVVRRADGQPGLQGGHLAAGQGSDWPGGGGRFSGGPCWCEWVCSTRLLLG